MPNEGQPQHEPEAKLLTASPLGSNELPSTYHDAVELLWSRINFERTGHAPYTVSHYRLDRMRAILERLGNPHLAYPIVHVAGTKGKGTVCSLLSAALQASGFRTGLCTSPHFERVEERFVVDGEPPGESELVDLVRQAAEAANKVEMQGYGLSTFFELTTAIGFLHLARRQVDVGVVEVGLGGRLDSTNVCQPKCCVITSISLDHQRQLGDTIAKIAAEKAGIIKPRVPVVVAARDRSAVDVILETARQQGAPAITLGRDFEVSWSPSWGCDNPTESIFATNRVVFGSAAAPKQTEQAPIRGLHADKDLDVTCDALNTALEGECSHREHSGGGQSRGRNAFEAASESRTSAPGEETSGGVDCAGMWPTRLLGAHQADNVAAVVAALHILQQQGMPIDWCGARRAVQATQPRGRLQIVGSSPIQIIDTAHNVDSISAGLHAVNDHFRVQAGRSTVDQGSGLVTVFASSRDKDYEQMLGMLLEASQLVVLTEYRLQSRAVPLARLAVVADRLCRNARSDGRPCCGQVLTESSSANAWNVALQHAPPGGVVLACGSFFLAAELFSHLSAGPDRRACSQGC